jgi:hypothetical protein
VLRGGKSYAHLLMRSRAIMRRRNFSLSNGADDDDFKSDLQSHRTRTYTHHPFAFLLLLANVADVPRFVNSLSPKTTRENTI